MAQPTSKPIFLDEKKRRWKRLRRVLDISAAVGLLVFIVFVLGVIRMRPLPVLLLNAPKRNFRALNEPPATADDKAKRVRSAHRRTDRRASDIPLNADEGLRAAFYVEWDPASYSSLKQHVKQIDLLFCDWLHVITPDGKLTGYNSEFKPFDVVDGSGVHTVDIEAKVQRSIVDAGSDTDLFPMVSNNDIAKNAFVPDVVGQFLKDPAAQQRFLTQAMRFLASNQRYRGLSLDFEDIPSDAQPAYRQLIASLSTALHVRGLKLYVNVPVQDDDWDLKFMAANSDGLMLMNYDQHQTESGPGPIASQDWFVQNLQNVLKVVPKDKIICDIGSYGYDWTMTRAPSPVAPKKGHKAAPPKTFTPEVVRVDNRSMQEVWQSAADSGSEVDLDDASLNPHYKYDDEDNKERHEVWFLDAVTTLNEMRAARRLGLQTFALWRLGSEDQSMWKIWDQPIKANPVKDLAVVPPGWDLDIEGTGDIMHVSGSPTNGSRTLTIDDDTKLIDSEEISHYPLSYTVNYFGYHPKKLALSFDDGPDAEWTPKILDALKKLNVKGAFFMIGEEAENNVSVMQRVYREGHEVGNHTFTHPDISAISNRELDLQMNLTERLFAAKLGVQPLYFRPPYSIDQEPDTLDQAAPVERLQQRGYIVVGNKIDTDDWDEHPRKTPQQIVDSVLRQIAAMKDRPDKAGSVILMHDGGGDRSVTVATLPLLVNTLRAQGYEFVPVSELVGKTHDQVMPKLTARQRQMAIVDSIAFAGISAFNHFVIGVFFVGDILMSGRLIIIGLFAIIDRFRRRKNFAAPDYQPRVAVLIPAYNEEKVIVRTIRSVMMSTYKNLHIIVIDDGSKDRTAEVAREAYPADIASGRLTVVRKENAGKAEALNYALASYVHEEIYVGIDADTVIAHDAIARLVPHFANPQIGAVAGNAKVGNRVNLWTRWQALEYITSQNFERRALDLFDVVVVVPGAIGAWRTAAVHAGGGYHSNTVAEDADLTMILLEQGLSVIYEDRALAFTEAPVNMDGLMRQRFRWSFGIMQAVFKHLGAITKRRAMGLFALPNIIVFQIMLPLVSPLIDLMFVASFFKFLYDRHFHPESASSANFEKLLYFFLAFMIIDFSASALAFLLERKHPASKGDGWLLVHIWIQRFSYRQVFSVVLFKTVKRVIDGRPFSWDKLERTAQMSKATDQMIDGTPSPK
jgi:cellulose synthase/poly-beta-1,6-N-acetylglucosamine synthase-like glycosyltransferase/peptidoglycan/xylan/chitin deacetylase (PgdA/CDA1 family)/spore germination protein YaaH